MMTVSMSDVFSGSKPEDSTCHSSLRKTASEAWDAAAVKERVQVNI